MNQQSNIQAGDLVEILNLKANQIEAGGDKFIELRNRLFVGQRFYVESSYDQNFYLEGLEQFYSFQSFQLLLIKKSNELLR